MSKRILVLPFLFFIQVGAVTRNITEEDITRRIFLTLEFNPSSITQETLGQLINDVEVKSRAAGLESKKVIATILTKLDSKIENYRKINNGSKNGYQTGLVCLGLSACFTAMAYYSYHSYLAAPKKRARLRKELNWLGAGYVNVGMGRAWTSVSSSVRLKNGNAIESKLFQLAHSGSDAEDIVSFIVEFFVATSMAIIIAWMGVNEMLDQKYPEYYHQKYCFIKEQLEQYLNQ